MGGSLLDEQPVNAGHKNNDSWDSSIVGLPEATLLTKAGEFWTDRQPLGEIYTKMDYLSKETFGLSEAALLNKPGIDLA